MSRSANSKASIFTTGLRERPFEQRITQEMKALRERKQSEFLAVRQELGIRELKGQLEDKLPALSVEADEGNIKVLQPFN